MYCAVGLGTHSYAVGSEKTEWNLMGLRCLIWNQHQLLKVCKDESLHKIATSAEPATLDSHHRYLAAEEFARMERDIAAARTRWDRRPDKEITLNDGYVYEDDIIMDDASDDDQDGHGHDHATDEIARNDGNVHRERNAGGPSSGENEQ